MSSTNIKKQVKRFRQEFHLQEVSAEALEDIFEQQGLRNMPSLILENICRVVLIIKRGNGSNLQLHNHYT